MKAITPNKIFDARGNLIWQGGLGSAQTVSSINRATQLVNQSSALASQLRDSKPSDTPNNVGKAAGSIATAAGTIAGVALLVPPPAGPAVALVAGAVAAVAGLISSIWGSDSDEATYALAAQIQQENTKIERENYQLDQKRDALVASIQNAMPAVKAFAKQENIDLNTAVNGLNGFLSGLGNASQQLKTAQSTNDFLKAQQNQRILDISELTKSFEAVADTLVAKQRQLQLMKSIQTYGSYGAGAVGLGALVFGGIKIAKGNYTTGAISAGSGLALAALAYWLYTQSRKTEVLSQQGQQVLKQAEVAINNTNQSQFPTKGQMVAAFQQYRPSDVNHLNSYNEKDGTFSNGNWRMSVVSSNPIRVKAAKGGEVFYIDTQYFVSKNQGVKGLKGWKGIGLRGYAEEMKGLPTASLLR
jgi:hypothetical protein